MRENWPIILSNKIQEYQAKQFCYGTVDCFSFVVDVVGTLTGRDLLKGHKKRYSTFIGGLRQMKKVYGVSKLDQWCNLHFASKPITYAARGDVVLYDNALGICNGRESVFVSESGISFVLTLKCTKAWEITNA